MPALSTVKLRTAAKERRRKNGREFIRNHLPGGRTAITADTEYPIMSAARLRREVARLGQGVRSP